jgi:hypothetical protein
MTPGVAETERHTVPDIRDSVGHFGGNSLHIPREGFSFAEPATGTREGRVPSSGWR